MGLIQSLRLANELIASPGPEVTKRLFADADGVFWVDWREEDAQIVALCAKSMNDRLLTAERDGEGLVIDYRGKSVKVAPGAKGDERDLTLLALNKVLKPQYEIRYVRASDGGDTAAFMSLPASQWKGFEKQFGDRVAAAFAKLGKDTPIFDGEQPAMEGTRSKDAASDPAQARLVKFSRVHPRLCTVAQARQWKKALGDPVIAPLAGDLVVAYFLDVEPDFPLVTDSLLAEFDMDREGLAKLAYSNALKAWTKVKIVERDGITQMRGGPVVGGIDMTASIALNPATWKLTEQYDGPFVAAFPSHGHAYSAPLKSPEAVAALRKELAAMDFAAPGGLTPQLFTRDDSGWKVYKP